LSSSFELAAMKFFLRNLARLGAVVTLLALAAAASAQSNASLSGFVYIDRDNNGQLAFNNSANPELIISGATVDLFRITGTTSTLVTSQLTDAIGRYSFMGLSAGTYRLAQTQPLGYVDGLDTLGVLTSNTGGTAPTGTNAGTVGADQFTTIVLLANTVGNLYNFGERGLAPGFVSKRYLLGTAPPPIPVTPDAGEVGIDAELTVPEPTAMVAMVIALGAFAARRRAR
jgi:hypothetical protein